MGSIIAAYAHHPPMAPLCTSVPELYLKKARNFVRQTAKRYARSFGEGQDVAAFFFTGRDGFSSNIVAHLRGLHAGTVMQVVGHWR